MKNLKNCELCKRVARVHCESDQANLCWSCDLKVHSANFIVAKHSRTLLCHICRSPTPWTAAGSGLVPTVSVCRNCMKSYDFFRVDDKESRDETENEDEEDEDEDEDEEEVENFDDKDVDGGDIQVVPWTPSTPPPNSDEERESCYSSSSSSSQSPSPSRVGAQRKQKRKHEMALIPNLKARRERRRMSAPAVEESEDFSS